MIVLITFYQYSTFSEYSSRKQLFCLSRWTLNESQCHWNKHAPRNSLSSFLHSTTFIGLVYTKKWWTLHTKCVPNLWIISIRLQQYPMQVHKVKKNSWRIFVSQLQSTLVIPSHFLSCVRLCPKLNV